MPALSSQLSIQSIIETKQIVTFAFFGRNGQDKYQMIINLGTDAVSNYIAGGSLIDCLPSEDSFDWIMLDAKERLIELQLL
jgi:hypothetical protein